MNSCEWMILGSEKLATVDLASGLSLVNTDITAIFALFFRVQASKNGEQFMSPYALSGRGALEKRSSLSQKTAEDWGPFAKSATVGLSSGHLSDLKTLARARVGAANLTADGYGIAFLSRASAAAAWRRIPVSGLKSAVSGGRTSPRRPVL